MKLFKSLVQKPLFEILDLLMALLDNIVNSRLSELAPSTKNIAEIGNGSIPTKCLFDSTFQD